MDRTGLHLKVALWILLLGAWLGPGAHAAERYTVDRAQSFVRIAAKMCEPDVLKGEFGDVSGEIRLDETNLENSSITLTLNVADVVFDHEFHRTDNIKDIALGERLLNVIKFPLVTFKSTHVVRTNEQKIESYGESSRIIVATVKGELTLVGVKRPFEMEVTFHESTGLTKDGRIVAAFSALGTLKRSDFGVIYGLDRVGIRRMGDEVMVMASITANRSQ